MINKFQQGGLAQQMILLFIMDISQATGALPEQVMQLVLLVALQDQNRLALAVLMWKNQDIKGAVQTLTGLQMARKGAKLNYLKKINNTCPEGTQLTYYKVGGQICSKCEAIAKQKSINVMDAIKAEMFQPGGKFNTELKTTQKSTTWTKEDDAKRLKYKTLGNVLNTKTYTTYSRNTPEERRDSAALEVKWKNASNKKDFKGVEEEKNGAKITTKACPKCGKVHAGKCGSKLMRKKKKCACGNKLDAKKCGGKTALKKKPMDKCGAKLKEMKCGSKMKKKHELGGILEAMLKFAKGGSLNGVPFKN